MIPSVLAVTLAAAVAAFQVVLAAGAPLGAFAWGGRAPGRLPTTLRIASATSVPVYVVVLLVALGAVDVGPIAPPRWLLWMFTGMFGLSTLLNAVSRSRQERFLMTPVAAGLALSFALLARGVAA